MIARSLENALTQYSLGWYSFDSNSAKFKFASFSQSSTEKCRAVIIHFATMVL